MKEAHRGRAGNHCEVVLKNIETSLSDSEF